MEILGVTENIIQYRRKHIIIGEIEPGQRLNEMELSSRLGVSRPPLREAFRVLESEQIVSIIPRKGCFVKDISIQHCREIYEAREMIECYSIDLLKTKNRRDIPEVASALASVSPHLPIPSPDTLEESIKYHNFFSNFHVKLVETTNNPWVIHFYRSIASSLARYQFLCYKFEIPTKAHEEHQRILELIREGDFDQAKGMLKHHSNTLLKRIENRIHERASKELRAVVRK